MEIKKILKFSIPQILGTLIFTLGVAGLVVAGLGSGPIDAAAYFASVLFGFTQGTWTFILNGLLAVTLLLATKNLKVFLNIVMLLVASVLIDFWIGIYENIFSFDVINTTINNNNGFVTGLSVAIFSFFMVAFGVSILINFKSILSPLDAFTVFIAKFTKKYFIAKILIDTTFLVIALILGFIIGTSYISNQINFFSLVIVFGTGPVINILLDLYKKNSKGEKVNDGIEQVY